MTEDHPKCVHGVAYKITEAEFDYMYKTEGDGRLGGYQLYTVKLRSYEGEEIEAITLHIPYWVAPSRRDFAPSTRYRDLIVSGCEKEQLDATYTAWVAKHAFVDLDDFAKNYPGWFRFAKAYRMMMLPFATLLWWPTLLKFPHTPYTTRTMRRIIFFPFDVIFLIGTRVSQRFADACLMLFAPQELKRLFCSSHLNKM
jgi:hypothetical protein